MNHCHSICASVLPFLLALSLFCVIIFQLCPLFAQNYYVSNHGDDSTSGTTVSNPWKTIAKVNSHELQPGDNIYFSRDNKWGERLNLDDSGTATEPITYTAYGIGNDPTIKQIYHRSYLGKADYNTIEDLKVTNPTGDGCTVKDIDYLTVRNCDFVSCKGQGFYGDKNNTNILIEDCTFYDNDYQGIYSSGIGCSITVRRVTAWLNGIRGAAEIDLKIANLDNITVGGQTAIVEFCHSYSANCPGGSGIDSGAVNTIYRYNYVHDNNENGLSIKGLDGGYAKVYGNISHSNLYGIESWPAGRALNGPEMYVYNNTTVGNTVNGIFICNPSSARVFNNIIWNNGKAGEWSSNGQYHIQKRLPEQTDPMNVLTMDYNLLTPVPPQTAVHLSGYNRSNHIRYTFKEWQQLGYNLHGIDVDPLFANYLADNFTLKKNSPAISAGLDLGVDYEKVLDPIGTNFTTIPPTVRLIRQCNGKWCIGAFAYNEPKKCNNLLRFNVRILNKQEEANEKEKKLYQQPCPIGHNKK